MCIICRLKGPLINCDDNGDAVDFDISKYYGYDCQYFEKTHIIDSSARQYLSDTLEIFR